MIVQEVTTPVRLLARLFDLCRWQVVYLRLAPGVSSSPWMARLDLTALGSLDLTSRGPEEAANGCIRLVDGWQVSELNSLLIRLAKCPVDAEAVLRVALLRRLTASSADAFTIDTWVRSTEPRSVAIFARSWWDAALLRSYLVPRVKVFDASHRVNFLFRRVSEALTNARIRVFGALRDLSWFGSQLSSDKSPEVEIEYQPLAGLPSKAGVAMFLPKGLSYSTLYSYDFWTSPVPSSPISSKQLTFFSRLPARDPQGQPCAPYPQTAGVWTDLRATIGLLRRIPLRIIMKTRWRVLWNQCATVARAQSLALALRRDLPNAGLAVFSFEIQIPQDLVLALKIGGIQSAAVSERPALLFRSIAPYAVDVLFTAGPAFSCAVQESSAVFASSTTAVGLWRTDLVFEAREKQRPKLLSELRSGFRHVVLVLPFELHPDEDPSTYPLVTGVAAITDFLQDILRLATKMNDTLFVIRGKTDRWLSEPSCAQMVSRVCVQRNLLVDRDYVTPGRTYELAAFADAVVARPTSLVDELLAIGLPCVVHDFTRNATNLARSTYSYLPRMVWAESWDELETRLEFALEDGGKHFRTQWEPDRTRLFGDLSDGSVRHRVRDLLELLAVRTCSARGV